MSSGLFKVISTFEDANGDPLTGKEYKVHLYDEDRFFDDKLNDSGLDANGCADFLIAVADIMSIDSLDERTPDLYFVVKKDGKEIFRSETFPNVDFEAKDPTTKRASGLTKSFGPFKVEL